MSPEQLHSARDVDARSDLWSLGAVLHQLISGRPPFEAESAAAVGAKIAASAPTPLARGCPEAPEGLAAVLLRCLEKDPARRFQDIGELARALAPYASEASRLSVDRISRVVGAGLRSGDAVALGPAPVVPERSTTSRAWDAPTAPLKRRAPLFAAAALLATGAVAYALRGGPSATPGLAAAIEMTAPSIATPTVTATIMPFSSAIAGAPTVVPLAVEKANRAPAASTRVAPQASSRPPVKKGGPATAKAVDPLDPALMGR